MRTAPIALIGAAKRRPKDRLNTSMLTLGEFKSNSGRVLPWKIECDDLTQEDWACAARIVMDCVGWFGEVEGVPSGGLPFADALRPFVTAGPLLIVDDVLTTGASMEAQRDGRKANGFVLYARGPYPTWVRPIFETSF